MNDIKKIIDTNISLKVKNSICKTIETGIYIFKELKENNNSLFMTDLSSNITQKLLSYCINRQFAPDMIDNEIKYEVYLKNVNPFGYKIVELKNEKIILHISKSKTLLPNKAKYKLELAHNNDFNSNQQVMKVFEDKIVKTADSPYYVCITYDLDKLLNIKSVNIVVPNYNMNEIIYSEDIYISRFSLVDNIDKEDVEKKVVKIKEELKKTNIL